MMNKMKLVYIAGVYRGKCIDDIYENIQVARKYAKKYWNLNYAVICPHMNSAFMDGSCTDEVFLDGGIEILKRCDIIVMLPNWKNSPGAINEFNIAINNGLKIIYED